MITPTRLTLGPLAASWVSWSSSQTPTAKKRSSNFSEVDPVSHFPHAKKCWRAKTKTYKSWAKTIRWYKCWDCLVLSPAKISTSCLTTVPKITSRLFRRRDLSQHSENHFPRHPKSCSRFWKLFWRSILILVYQPKIVSKLIILTTSGWNSLRLVHLAKLFSAVKFKMIKFNWPH